MDRSTHKKTLWIITLVILTLLYVRVRYLTIELSFEVGQLRQRQLTLEDNKRTLLLELSTLLHPKRIENIAEKKYNMGFDQENATVIYVQE